MSLLQLSSLRQGVLTGTYGDTTANVALGGPVPFAGRPAFEGFAFDCDSGVDKVLELVGTTTLGDSLRLAV